MHASKQSFDPSYPNVHFSVELCNVCKRIRAHLNFYLSRYHSLDHAIRQCSTVFEFAHAGLGSTEAPLAVRWLCVSYIFYKRTSDPHLKQQRARSISQKLGFSRPTTAKAAQAMLDLDYSAELLKKSGHQGLPSSGTANPPKMAGGVAAGTSICAAKVYVLAMSLSKSFVVIMSQTLWVSMLHTA